MTRICQPMIPGPSRAVRAAVRAAQASVLLFGATTSGADNNHQLFLVRPDGSESKQVTHDEAKRFGSPAISPDGKQIAADRAPAEADVQATTIVVMDRDGKHLRELGPGAMPQWSPDGTRLAFHSYENGGEIVVYYLKTGKRSVVARHWGSPRWLRDGQGIISIKQGEGFFVVDLTTGEEGSLGVAEAVAPYQGFDLSADGRQLLFGDSNLGGVVILQFRDNGRLENANHLLGDARCTFCSWNPEGDRFVVSLTSAPGGKPSLHLVDVADKRPRYLAGQPQDAANVNPSWSDDGQWIVFSSD